MGSSRCHNQRPAREATEPPYDFAKGFREASTGDEEAAYAFWHNVSRLAHGLGRTVCRGKSLPGDCVEDVVQDALLRVMRQPPRTLAQVRRWPAYLAKIIAHCAVDAIRVRMRRDREKPLSCVPGDGEELMDAIERLAACDDTPLACAVNAERLQLVETILADEAKERAQVFRLYLGGLTYREISERSGVPINTVGVWVYRVKKLLAPLREGLVSERRADG